jgi:hypothetical protein
VFGDPTVQNAVMVPSGWFPATFTPRTADPYRVRIEDGGVVSSLHATAMVGHRVLLEAALARMTNTRRVHSLAVGAGPFTWIGSRARCREVWPEFEDSHNGRSQATLRATATLGRHTVIGGAEYEDNKRWGASGQDDIRARERETLGSRQSARASRESCTTASQPNTSRTAGGSPID